MEQFFATFFKSCKQCKDHHIYILKVKIKQCITNMSYFSMLTFYHFEGTDVNYTTEHGSTGTL